MAATRLVVSVSICLSVLNCGNDSAPAVMPDFYPEARSAFYGDWLGTMSTVRFNPITIYDIPEFWTDVNCLLKFDVFQYNLQLAVRENTRETVYSLSGEWKWETDAPGRLVFFNQQESMIRTLEIGGVRRSYHTTLSLINSSICKLEFTDGFNRLIMYDLDKDPGLSKFPDSTILILTKNQ